MGDEIVREVEQFLYREARLLDERRFHEWLELFTDDVHYWMGARTNRYPRSSKAIAILSPNRYVEDDHTREDELSILDETKETLAGRVARLDTGMAWAEDPPSRTRHVITNIEVARSIPTSSSTAVGPRAKRTFTSAGGRMSCAASTAPGRSPAAS
jgi:3-phenylpropionate/cinnamic acid dioxygenase small subunit